MQAYNVLISDRFQAQATSFPFSAPPSPIPSVP